MNNNDINKRNSIMKKHLLNAAVLLTKLILLAIMGFILLKSIFNIINFDTIKISKIVLSLVACGVIAILFYFFAVLIEMLYSKFGYKISYKNPIIETINRIRHFHWNSNRFLKNHRIG